MTGQLFEDVMVSFAFVCRCGMRHWVTLGSGGAFRRCGCGVITEFEVDAGGLIIQKTHAPQPMSIFMDSTARRAAVRAAVDSAEILPDRFAAPEGPIASTKKRALQHSLRIGKDLRIIRDEMGLQWWRRVVGVDNIPRDCEGALRLVLDDLGDAEYWRLLGREEEADEGAGDDCDLRPVDPRLIGRILP